MMTCVSVLEGAPALVVVSVACAALIFGTADARSASAQERPAWASDAHEPYLNPLAPACPARARRRVGSPALARVARRLRRAVREARAAAPGWTNTEVGRLGRSYRIRSFRTGRCGSPLEAVFGIGNAHFRPGEYDDVFVTAVHPLSPPTIPETTAAAWGDLREAMPAERAAVQALAVAVEEYDWARAGLQPFVVHAGWADAVGSDVWGLAIYDAERREVLFVFAERAWHFG